MAYKWDNPHEWFEQFWRGKIEQGSSELYSIGMELARQLDSDGIQDLFQSDMDADGYFQEVATAECPSCGESFTARCQSRRRMGSGMCITGKAVTRKEARGR
jgi:hypothetical protein